MDRLRNYHNAYLPSNVYFVVSKVASIELSFLLQ